MTKIVVRMKKILKVYHEAIANCELFLTQRRIQSPVKHLRWRVLRK